MKTDKLLKLIQQKKAMRSGGALPLPKAQTGFNFLQPNDPKLPRVILPPNKYASSEVAQSIGGEGGYPAYLIPTVKQGKRLFNPNYEFEKSNDILGGPFKTYQEADKWEREVRHPYVEKGQPIPSPLKWWGEGYRQGGSLPKAQIGIPNYLMNIPESQRFPKQVERTVAYPQGYIENRVNLMHLVYL